MLDKAIQDFDYNEQNVLTNLHIMPSQFEEEDFYRLNEVLSAQEEKDRVVDGSDFLEQMGISQKGASQGI